MGVLIQIRDVPEDVHRTLKVRAAAQGLSLTEYLRGLLEAETARPTIDELSKRIEARGPLEGDFDIVEIVREIRGPLPED